VTTGCGLTVPQRDSLERDGYLLMPSLLDKTIVDRLRARLAELVVQAVDAGRADYGNPDTVEAGVVHTKLDLADPDLAPLYDHRLLAEAATAVLGQPWHVSGLNLRAPLPGCGHQGLHPDFEHRRIDGWQTLSAMWCITAFTPDNGPLRVIPGSHRVSRNPVDVLPLGCEMGPHPDEVKIVAPAGSVVLFNSADLWHSGTFNYSPEPRVAVTAGFAPGDSPQPTAC
jgi:ectoine hydroxylase-related dioxygenase (phytanoyl-CoA dioxygenase family)